ncbi:sarcosine oxidase [Lophiostoma macrostomum CBS 122681]|uniref:Sarcosine oxidase n=1 Tax=Lophiostoma macrostomum CBS 122681 TaxID=1314788 RepID=A0A6A6TL48_9PLEO|nr:sarcosine oxidase [Lophiostoma macrostomum CBS 122681]
MASAESPQIPSSILIIGSGVFGLTTAWSLCKNPLFKDTKITLVDRQPFPAPDSSSIDTSRIVRPDYASPPYTRLATTAQNLWRKSFAPEHYYENGLCITASGPEQQYVSSALWNVKSLGTDRVETLNTPSDIARVCSLEQNGYGDTPERPGGGTMGYVNWSSGWADAEGAMRWLYTQVTSHERVHFITGTVTQLAIDHSTNTVTGAHLRNSSTPTLSADLTLLAAGAWSPALLDLRGICKATGQALVYLPISASEQEKLGNKPTLLNLSTGLFIIPPSHNLLKIARHGHGYTNPTTIPHPETAERNRITVSLPPPYTPTNAPAVPAEGQKACRHFLAAVHPSLAKPSRPFTKSRICWYTDTRSGDFLIDYHPKYKGLFVATGGSGHAFKFAPVIGDAILDCMLGNTPEDFKGKWNWPSTRVPEELWEGDGSRGGPTGMVLAEEAAKGVSRL